MHITRRVLASLFLVMTLSTKDESYAAALSSLSMSGGLTSKTVVVGLNAAFQKRFVLDPSTPLTPGSVHRAARVEEGLGGKGQDVAVALSQLWPTPGRRPLALAQFVGTGPGGDAVMSLLSDTMGSSGDEGVAAGWDALTVRCRSPMRTCTTIVGSDTSTELVEPSGVIEEDEMDGLFGRIDALAAAAAAAAPENAGGESQGTSGAAALCIMGSMPPGCPDETYANLFSSVVGEKTLTLVDSVIGLKALLSAMSSKRAESGASGGSVLKVNAAELCRLAGVERSGGGEAEGATRDELVEAVDRFVAAYCDGTGGAALDYMAITDGRHAAHLVEVGRGEDSRRVLRMDVVDISGEGDTLYPIGAGDTVAAGTLAAWLNLREDGTVSSPVPKETRQAMLNWRDEIQVHDGDEELRNILTAFAFGLACGSASCLQQENSVFAMNDAIKLFNKMSKPSL